MRVHRKTSSAILEKNKDDSSSCGVDYKAIYENVKNYLVFKISITSNFNERLVYLDVLDYMGRIKLEASKIKK